MVPETYNLESSLSLTKFFKRFERYYVHEFTSPHYKPDPEEQCQELGRFIEGELRIAYDALGGSLLGYKTMKHELLAWHREQQVGRSYKLKAKLRKAEMRASDTYTLYCMRLQKFAQRAYAHNSKEGARELRQKLLSSMPTPFVELVDNRIETKKITNPHAKLTWDDILAVARSEDKKRKRQELMEDGVAIAGPLVRYVNITQPLNAQLNDTPAQPRPSAACSQPEGIQPAVPMAQIGSAAAGVKQCHYCGMVGHLADKCFKRESCYRCGELGHYYQECPSREAKLCFRPVCPTCNGPHPDLCPKIFRRIEN